MVKASLIVGLSTLLALSAGYAQTDDSTNEQPAKMISATVTNGAVAANSATAPKEASKVKIHKSGTWTPELSDEENATLFAIAEDTLTWCVNGGGSSFQFNKYKLTPKLKVPTHTFVTLKIRGALRGCIGSLPPSTPQPLYESVHENAINAAMRDWRFTPVTPAELPKIDIDVSLLSPVTDIKSLDEFKLGEHGIIIIKGGHRAVYLPEVAPEQGWTKEETLASLSEKAGMRPDAWKEGAKFQIYSSVVLSK
jgi:AmmeMemoRadiSam system protein A